MKKIKREIKGITLVALAVTIIILLILSGIVVTIILGKEGIIAKAQRARNTYINASERELSDLEKLFSSIQIATNGESNITIDMETLSQYINEIVDEKLKESQSVNAQLQSKIEELQQKNNALEQKDLELETRINNIRDNKITYTYKELASVSSTTSKTVTLKDSLSNYKYVIVVRTTTAADGTTYYSGLIPVEAFRNGYKYATSSSQNANICQYKSETTCAMYATDSTSITHLYGVQ